jgi:hypothetical protein
MNCKDFREVADSYLSDELLTETNHEMIRHMEACADCRGVIAARREIRVRLKTAVLKSDVYQIDGNFDHNLMTRLRYEQEQTGRRSWFGIRSLAFAVGLLIVGVLAFSVLSNLDGVSGSDHLVAGFSEDSLLNIASGDHQYCAVEYGLEEAPVAINEGDPEYVGLEKVVGSSIPEKLKDHKLVEAHSCKFKDIRFAHFVLKGANDTLSVLVTPSRSAGPKNSMTISDNSSRAYRISSFEVGTNAVFVLSNLNESDNRKAAEAINTPFRNYFDGKNNIKTAMLTYYSFGP